MGIAQARRRYDTFSAAKAAIGDAVRSSGPAMKREAMAMRGNVGPEQQWH